MLVIDDISLRVAGRLLLEGASAQHSGRRPRRPGRPQRHRQDHAVPRHRRRHRARARRYRAARRAPASAGWRRRRRTGPNSLIDSRARGRPRAHAPARRSRDRAPIRIASPRSRRGSPTSAPMRRRRAPPRSWPASASRMPTSSAPCSEFSGGWRMRVALAAVLFAEPDLLLLDEPTNYLDLEGTLWLEDHLARYPRTVIVISHDRDLLDNAVDSILHLDGRQAHVLSRRLYRVRAPAARAPGARPQARQKAGGERKQLTAFVERFRAKATKARQAQSRLKLLAKLEPIAARVADEVRPIDDPGAATSRCRRRSSRSTTSRSATSRASRCCAGSRCASTTTTASRCSAPTATASRRWSSCCPAGWRRLSGGITRADKLEVAYFAQHQLDELNPAASAYDHVRQLMPDAPEAKVRARAGAIGFSGACRRHAGRQPLGRREGAAAARARHLRRRRISSCSTSRPTISTSTAAPR